MKRPHLMLNLCYSLGEKRVLLDTALASIRHGADSGRRLSLEPKHYPSALQQHRATFVTLHKAGELRGCIGTLEPYQPLICDTAEHAYQAAFADPRFPPVVSVEIEQLAIHIAVLSPPELLHFSSETELLRQLQPNIDGLILQEGQQRSTFLPAVWQSLPKPEDFWRRLKQKAQLPADYWSDTLQVWRYRAEDIS